MEEDEGWGEAGVEMEEGEAKASRWKMEKLGRSQGVEMEKLGIEMEDGEPKALKHDGNKRAGSEKSRSQGIAMEDGEVEASRWKMEKLRSQVVEMEDGRWGEVEASKHDGNQKAGVEKSRRRKMAVIRRQK